MTMLSVTRKGDPEQQLTELAKRLAAAIDRCDDTGKLANLAPAVSRDDTAFDRAEGW